ncbi:glycosyltransferase [Salinicola tamaricis]|uniref:glycosyltransferase n=1 Tax=Salinicola tamaricis TaxID=1771309 RepID=UPI0030F3E0E0
MVHAGTQETFGLVALEAMACGIPVIAARAGALGGERTAGLRPAQRAALPCRYARGVRELFTQHDAEQAGRRARRYVERHTTGTSSSMVCSRTIAA